VKDVTVSGIPRYDANGTSLRAARDVHQVGKRDVVTEVQVATRGTADVGVALRARRPA